MKYKEVMKDYYNEVNNISELLKKMVDSYRLLIAGAAELNNIPEARTSHVKEAVKRADRLGDTIDHMISILDKCSETYFQYCTVIGEHIMKSSDSKTILTEVDDDLLYQNTNSFGTVQPRNEEDED